MSHTLCFVAACGTDQLPSRAVTEGVERVGDVELAYSRCGTGPAVLCIPGAMGTASTDFAPQLQALSAAHTVVAFDPRGYGRSRPPARDFPDGFYERDARDGAGLMRALGFAENGYSVLGWSDGANSAIHLAACFPDEVHKLVVWGANTRLNQDDIDAFNATRDVKTTWSKRQRETMSAVYGLDGLQEMWSAGCDAWERIVAESDGNVCGAEAALVRCPTFVLHGAKDPMIYPEHPRELVATIGPTLRHSVLPSLRCFGTGLYSD
jgi:valacyclovir hydrolase